MKKHLGKYVLLLTIVAICVFEGAVCLWVGFHRAPTSNATTNTDTTSFVTAGDGADIYDHPEAVQDLYNLIAGKSGAKLSDLQAMIDEVTGGDREELVSSAVFRAKEYGKTNKRYSSGVRWSNVAGDGAIQFQGRGSRNRRCRQNTKHRVNALVG